MLKSKSIVDIMSPPSMLQESDKKNYELEIRKFKFQINNS